MVVYIQAEYTGACTYLIFSPLLKPYVGQTVAFNARMHTHKSNGKNARINHEKWKAGEHDKVCAISFAIHKHGWENMRIIILEKYSEWDQQLLDEREKHFIRFYDSFKNGYNCNEGGNRNKGPAKHTAETKAKMSVAQMGKTHTAEVKAKMSAAHEKRPVTSCLIKQEYADGTQLVKFDSYASVREAEKQTGVYNAHISKCCNKKQKTAGGFLWFFTEENHPPQIIWVGTHRVPRIGDVPRVGKSTHKRAIFSVSPAGEQQLHKGSHAAGRNLSTPDKKFYNGAISLCCNGKQKKHKGYTFSFATPEQIAEFKQNTKKRKRE